MAEKIDLNISPYYDDFDEDKKFHKVLFRAGRPIQARELTQTQSILQNQVERLGSFMFKEGSLVQGAQTDIDLDVYYIKVKSTNPNDDGDINVNDYISASHGKFYRGQTTGVICKVITSSVETTDDPATLFVKFISQGTDAWNSHNVYGDEILEEVTIDEDGVATSVESNDNDFETKTETVNDKPVGYASLASIQEGIVYSRGFYVKVDKQTIILEKYSRQPSFKIGLTINEQLISSADDLSLNDNAQGTTNENAAGADRLKLQLTLSKLSLLETDNLNFIETGRVNNGIVEKLVTEEKLGGITRTLARRTNDTNGDFIVNAFRPAIIEHLNDFNNNGFYTPIEGGDEDMFMLQVSPGKAYVKGFEITKIGTTNLPILKARSSSQLDNIGSPVRLGNELKVQNIHGLPDFGNETGGGNISELGVLGIYDTAIATDGTASGNLIGYSRVRDIRFHDGDDTSGVFDTSGSDIAQFKLSLFDVKLFTKITGTTSGATFKSGDRVVGSSSGAIGIVAEDVTSGGSAIYVHDVIGVFTDADSISAESNSATISNVTAVRTYNIDRARSVASTWQSNSANFTADVVVDDITTIQGSVSITSGSDQLVGTFGNLFLSELKEGDIVVDGLGNQHTISSVESNEAATFTANATATVSGNAVKKRAKLLRQDETVAIFAQPRDYVNKSTVTNTTVRRQEIVSVSSGSVSVTAADGESIINFDSRTGLTIACITASDSADVGKVFDPTSPSVTVTQTVDKSISISGTALSGLSDGDKLLVSYTVQNDDDNGVERRTKTLRQSRCLSVESASSSGVEYGLAYDHHDITLGVSDAFKVHGVYEGVGGADPLPPSATFASPDGTFVNFEKVVGQTSNAHAVVINYTANDTTYFYYTNENRFLEGEYIVGQKSNALGTINTLTDGSPDIKDRYFFDDGQRDGFYDLAKLTRKPNQPAPNGKILIVFDYFTSSGGQYYDVESYADVDYKDIPVYTANRVDLGGLEPDGTYELSDAIDCRPSVGQILGDTSFATDTPDPTSPTNLSDVSNNGGRYAPFSYENGRSFDASRTNISTTRASALDTPADSSAFTSDINFYVSRIDRVFLHKSGTMQVVHGTPAITPVKPRGIDEAIELFTLRIPAFTSDISKISTKILDHRRYTMKDIGKINTRLSNLERVTALSLLEKDVQSKQVLDKDGLDRFKSGFLVDNFNNHTKGNLSHPDYKVSLDIRKGFLRPTNHTSFVELELKSSISSKYKKTGDIVTLPYDEEQYISQPMASRSVNINPYNVFAYIGDIKLSPTMDTWVETKRLDDKNTTIDNYDIVFNAASDAGLLGEKWNDWQLSWCGEPEVVDDRVVSDTDGYWTADPAQGGSWVNGETVTQVQTKSKETYTRNGINTSVMEYTTEERHDRLVSVDVIPYIRSRLITVSGFGLKPNTNHYFFFDGKRVDSYVKPNSASYSADGSLEYTGIVRTDGTGRFEATFNIPNNSQIKFTTGNKELKVTSSYYDNPESASTGFATYYASGMLQTNQTEIISTRNGQVVTENLSDSKEIDKYDWTTGNTTVKDDYEDYPHVDTTPPIVVDPPITDQPDPDPVTEPPVDPAPSITGIQLGGISVNGYHSTGSGATFAYVQGGTPPFRYSWSGASGSASFTPSGNLLSVSASGYGSHTGSFSVTVTDSNGQTASASNEYSIVNKKKAEPPAPVKPTLPVGTSTQNNTVVEQNVADLTYHHFQFEEDLEVVLQNNVGERDRSIQTHITPPVNGHVPVLPQFSGTTSTRNNSVLSQVSREYRALNLFREPTRPKCGWLDPLAQSFLIQSGEGVSLTSIEVFFKTKSSSGVPVRMEVRNMINGYPGSTILPFSSVTLDASDIETSEDGTTGTTFTFESPVVLEGQKDYCFVLLSNSDEYEVWVSRMGEKEISTGQQITTQPSMGSMFKSQNASTWTAEQTDDIKYNMNVASYEIGTITDIRLENLDVPLKDLRPNPILTTQGQSYIKVLSTSHGLYDENSNGLLYGVKGDRKGSVVQVGNPQLTGVTQTGTYTDEATTTTGSGTGLTVDFEIEDIDGTYTVTDLRITHVGQGYEEGDTINVDNFEGSADLSFTVIAVEDTLAGIPLSVLYHNFDAVESIDIDSFNINLATRLEYWEGNNKLKSGWTALETTQGGGTGVKCTQNLYYDLIHTVFPSVVPPNTGIRVTARTTAMKSPEGHLATGESSYGIRDNSMDITLNDNNYLSNPSVIAAKRNETEEMSSQKSLQVRIQMYSFSSNVSPMIDLDSPGVILNMNRINKIDTSADVATGITHIPSTEPEGDNNAMVYITRKVNLENPATTLKVIADNFRPEGTELEFMYKIVRNDEETPLDDIGFEYFNTDGSDDSGTPADGRNFKEYEYTVEELPEFSSFMIKIVGKSRNTCQIPLVSSLRVLALA